ncbi:MAG TPA: hypothetical protein VG942_01855 [Hyphomonadaceae bacterium]|nr:hypothetical protein [Hyphomonadaceae bacterium]
MTAETGDIRLDAAAPAGSPFLSWPSVVRALIACAIASAALFVVFVAVMAAAIVLPNDKAIQKHLLDGIDQKYLAGTSYPSSPFGGDGHRYDMFSDCIGFGMNLSDAGGSLIQRIADTPTSVHARTDILPCEQLSLDLHTNNVKADSGYLRFWHGYQAVFRPLLSVMPYDAFVRSIAFMLFGALLFFAWRMERIFGPWAWPVILLPFFMISDFFTVSMVTTHALSLAWIFFTGALTPVVMQKFPNARRLALPLFAFIAGATYNFLNMLFNPPLAPALIAFIYVAMSLGKDGRKTWQTVAYAMALAGLWFAGFAAAWIEKWLLAAAVMGPDAVISELKQTFWKYQWTGTHLQVSIFSATRLNFFYNWYFAGALMASLAAGAALLAWTIRKHGDLTKRLADFAALIAPLLVVIAWVEVNRAHSSEHAGFVSRSFVLFSVLPLLAAIKLSRESRTRASERLATMA